MKEEILKLDYDNISFRDIKKIYKEKCLWLKRFFKLKINCVNVYKTKKGYHIYIWVNNRLSNQDILFLQLGFGSDFMRESHYWKRLRGSVLPRKQWNILFFHKRYAKVSRKKPSIEEFEPKKSEEIAKILNQ